MSFIPNAQEIYKHFKGNLYQIMAIATHTETDEQLVIYQAMYGDFKIYARPLSMFTSKVDKEKYPEATQEYRFELQGAAVIESLPEEKETPVEAKGSVETTENEELQLDPMVLAFLDAGSHEERLNILAALHHRIDDSMLLTMAIASDIELSEGTTEEKYQELKNCLLTLEKYEIQRLN